MSANKQYKKKYKKYKNKYMSLKLSRALNYMTKLRNDYSLARARPTDEDETNEISKIKAEWNRFVKYIHDNTTAFPQDLVDIILTLTLQWDGYMENIGGKINISDFL